MLTKYAFFAGTLKPNCEAEMRAFVDEHLKPLWRQFQPSQKVQILYGVEQEKNGPTIPLVLAVTYKNNADLEEAMESKARHQAREILPEFYERFFEEIELWHYVFEPEIFKD